MTTDQLNALLEALNRIDRRLAAVEAAISRFPRPNVVRLDAETTYAIERAAEARSKGALK